MGMWKNRQLVANRMRYAGGAAAIKPTGLATDSAAGKALAVPTDPVALAKFEETFRRFCSTFPDAFYITERGRVFLKDSAEKKVSAQ